MNYDNEITVACKYKKEELESLLLDKGFIKIDSYIVDDIYYVDKNVDLNQSVLEILKRYVLLRNICGKYYLTYKYKEYNNEEIIKQGKLDLEVLDKNKAHEFLILINYKDILTIHDEIDVYQKDDLIINVQLVNKKYVYIEIEESNNYKTIDEMIKALDDTGIDYDRSNYFVKKAEVVFNDKNNIC